METEWLSRDFSLDLLGPHLTHFPQPCTDLFAGKMFYQTEGTQGRALGCCAAIVKLQKYCHVRKDTAVFQLNGLGGGEVKKVSGSVQDKVVSFSESSSVSSLKQPPPTNPIGNDGFLWQLMKGH